jgi:DNA-binding CsgD family transcriptional regulator
MSTLRGTEDLIAQLAILRDGAPRLFDDWIPALRSVLGLDKAVFYEIRAEDHRFALDYLNSSGMVSSHRTLTSGLGNLIGDSGRRWGFYDPGRPEPEQRNTVVMTPPATQYQAVIELPRERARYGLRDTEGTAAAREALGRARNTYRQLGLEQDWQLRALVCEGDSLLAWVGGFSDQKPSERQRATLAALIPALQRRLSVERLLGSAQLLKVALDATMEGISRPAFLVDRFGNVLHANAAGRHRLNAAQGETKAALGHAVRSGGRAGGYSLTSIAATGSALCFLLVAPAESRQAAQLEHASRSWRLTRRQTAVLGLVAQGDANRTIAHKLGCSDRTVEMHLTAVFAKASVESRAALLVAFFTNH